MIRPALCLCFAACVPSLDVVGQANISCAADFDCPEGWSCASTSTCLKKRRSDDVAAPVLAGVAAVDARTVTVNFDELVDMSAAQLAFSPPLPVRALRIDGTSVTLDTGTQSAVVYDLTITGVRDVLGNAASPQSASFTGIAVPVDVSAPTLASPAAGSVVRTGEVALSWNGRLGATRYDVVVARDPGFSQPLDGSPFEVTAPSTSLTVTVSEPVRYYWRVSSDVSGASESRFDAIGDVVYVRCTAPPCADDDTAGNLSHPRANLARAVADARALGISRIRVAAGSYRGPISLDAGRSLEGGFDASFVERDPAVHVTEIDSDDIFTVHVSGEGDTQAAELSGFFLRASSASGSATLSISQASSSLVVRDNVIDVGEIGARLLSSEVVFEDNRVLFGDATAGRASAVGVAVVGGAPIVRRNDIAAFKGVPGLDSATAISLVGNATVVDNEVTLQGAYGTVTGIAVDGESATISRNVISLQGAQYGRGIGVSAATSSIAQNELSVDCDVQNAGLVLSATKSTTGVVERNRIRAGTAVRYARSNQALVVDLVEVSSAEISLRNNLLIAADVESTVTDVMTNALVITADGFTSGANIDVDNNTLRSGDGGSASGDVCTIATFAASGAASSLSLRNNMVISDAESTTARRGAFCRQQTGGTTFFARNYFASANGVVATLQSMTYPSVSALDSLFCNNGAGAAGACTPLGPSFSDATNMRMSMASPTALLSGGMTVASVTVDIDGVPRTCEATKCYSVGAYEVD